MTGYFPFSAYSVTYNQEYGCIFIQGSSALPNNHLISSNTFTYTFSEFGSVYYFAMEGQYALIENNIYSYNFALK